jgi:hypothetical protein
MLVMAFAPWLKYHFRMQELCEITHMEYSNYNNTKVFDYIGRL